MRSAIIAVVGMVAIHGCSEPESPAATDSAVTADATSRMDTGSSPASDTGSPLSGGDTFVENDASLDTADVVIDTAMETSADAAPLEAGVGHVSLSGMVTGSGEQTMAMAQFTDPAMPSMPCTLTPIAGCTLFTDCPKGSGMLPPTHDGGELRLTGPGLSSPGTVIGKVFGNYYQRILAMPMFAGGSELTVTTTGATVPAFKASVVAPARITLTSPTCSAMSCGDIDRSVDYAVTWSGTGAGRVALGIGTFDATPSITCEVNVSDGKAVIPKEALTKLVPGASFFSAIPTSFTTVTAGGWTVTFSAAQVGASGNVTIK